LRPPRRVPDHCRRSVRAWPAPPTCRSARRRGQRGCRCGS
jgi:hypothetical protein